jgi:serine/threonine protein phosphatase PrpC
MMMQIHLRLEKIISPPLRTPLALILLAISLIGIFFSVLLQIHLEAAAYPLKKANGKRRKKKPIEENTCKTQQQTSKELTASAHVVHSTLKIDDSDICQYQIGRYTIQMHSFCLHKKGGSPSEYEDRSAIGAQDDCLRVAVADGTTEGLFSDIWAELLVNSYCNHGAALFKSENLMTIHKEFIHQTCQQIAEMPEARHWFMYEKLERGTHATFAAVEFTKRNTIQMSAVGDSCIFWCIKNYCDQDKTEMFPELSGDDFGICPASICHIPGTWHKLHSKIRSNEITLERDCQFVLCTDAIAHWLVKEAREKNNFLAWEEIVKVSDVAAFNLLVENLRESKEIRNDDVTLVIVDVTQNV